jgi:hypothetical protein
MEIKNVVPLPALDIACIAHLRQAMTRTVIAIVLISWCFGAALAVENDTSNPGGEAVLSKAAVKATTDVVGLRDVVVGSVLNDRAQSIGDTTAVRQQAFIDLLIREARSSGCILRDLREGNQRQRNQINVGSAISVSLACEYARVLSFVNAVMATGPSASLQRMQVQRGKNEGSALVDARLEFALN